MSKNKEKKTDQPIAKIMMIGGETKQIKAITDEISDEQIREGEIFLQFFCDQWNKS